MGWIHPQPYPKLAFSFVLTCQRFILVDSPFHLSSAISIKVLTLPGRESTRDPLFLVKKLRNLGRLDGSASWASNY